MSFVYIDTAQVQTVVMESPEVAALLRFAELVAPRVPSTLEQPVRAVRAPGARKIIREDLRLLCRPRLQHRRIERPVNLDAITVRKQRLVAEHSIQQQPLIAVGARSAER